MLADLAKENSLGIATSFGNLSNAVAKGVANVITKLDELSQVLTGKTIAQNIDSVKVSLIMHSQQSPTLYKSLSIIQISWYLQLAF